MAASTFNPLYNGFIKELGSEAQRACQNIHIDKNSMRLFLNTGEQRFAVVGWIVLEKNNPHLKVRFKIGLDESFHPDAIKKLSAEKQNEKKEELQKIIDLYKKENIVMAEPGRPGLVHRMTIAKVKVDEPDLVEKNIPLGFSFKKDWRREEDEDELMLNIEFLNRSARNRNLFQKNPLALACYMFDPKLSLSKILSAEKKRDELKQRAEDFYYHLSRSIPIKIFKKITEGIMAEMDKEVRLHSKKDKDVEKKELEMDEKLKALMPNFADLDFDDDATVGENKKADSDNEEDEVIVADLDECYSQDIEESWNRIIKLGAEKRQAKIQDLLMKSLYLTLLLGPEKEVPRGLKNRSETIIEGFNAAKSIKFDMQHTPKEFKGYPPVLLIAAEKGYAKLMDVILQNNVEINFQDDQGNTALCLAAKNGHAQVVDELLKHGADPTILNKDNMSAVALATQSGHLETANVIKSFIEGSRHQLM